MNAEAEGVSVTMANLPLLKINTDMGVNRKWTMDGSSGITQYFHFHVIRCKLLCLVILHFTIAHGILQDLKKFRYHYWNCMPVLLTDLSLIDQPVEVTIIRFVLST